MSTSSALTPCVCGPRKRSTTLPAWSCHRCRTDWRHTTWGWIGTITLELETAVAVLHDICASVHQHGFRKIIVVNGHGGNVPLMGAVATKLSQAGIFVGTTSIWDLGAEALRRLEERDGGRIGHGGEMETSIQLYLRPFLVDMARATAEINPYIDPS
jgi:creatinine amidohydrolase/Fe(II)-dependent formamide hydrolase-like protein